MRPTRKSIADYNVRCDIIIIIVSCGGAKKSKKRNQFLCVLFRSMEINYLIRKFVPVIYILIRRRF